MWTEYTLDLVVLLLLFNRNVFIHSEMLKTQNSHVIANRVCANGKIDIQLHIGMSNISSIHFQSMFHFRINEVHILIHIKS